MGNREKVAKLSIRKNQKQVKVSTQIKKTKIYESDQESGIIYKKLVETSLQGIVIAQGIPPRLVYANSSISRMLGYTPAELTSLTIEQTQNLVHPDDRLSFFSRYKDRLEGKPVDPFYKVRAIRKDGSIGWFELSGTQIEYNGEPAVLATYMDITEHKRAEERLRENEALLDKSQAIVHVGSWELNLVANRLTWSDEVYRIFGLHPQEFSATYEAFLDIVHPDDRAAVDAAYSGSLRDGCNTYEIEHRIICRNSGEVRVVHEKCEHVKDASGRVVRSVGIVQDITERKQAEEEAKRLVQENAIMAEIGQIISSTLEIEDVYERFSEEVLKLIPFDRISINIVNPVNHTLTIAYVAGLEVPERSQGDIAPLTGTLTEKILTSKSGFFIATEDRAEVAKRFPKLLPSFDAGFRSMLSVPLISKDQAIGVLHLRSKKSNTYTEKDLSLAERVGNRISGAIANSLLFNEVRQSGKALRESEERYRTILDNIEDGYYEVDLSGNLIFFNDALCRILGYSREELIGMGNQQYTDETNRKKLFEAFNKVYRTGQPTKEFSWEVVRKDGTKRYGEVSISLTKDSEGKPVGFRGIARDVTDRKRAEEEIKHTLSLLNATLESTADGILVVDAKGKIKSFNQKFVQMWHIPETIIASGDDDQALTFVLSQLKYPEDFLSKVKELYSQPLAESFDLIEFKDGRVFERYSKAQQIGEQMLGRVWSFRDITERKKAEEALKQSEERYRTLVEESFDGIFFQKGSDIIFANHRLHEMLGYEQGDLEGRDHWTVYHPDYQALTRERALARLRGESPPSTYEVKFLRKDCSSFWGEINAKVINYLGEPGIQVWVRDISERKQAEDSLKESQEKFKFLAEKMADVVWTIDLNFHTTYVSPSIEKILGFTPEERRRQSLEQMVTPESLTRIQSLFLEEVQHERNEGMDPDRSLTIEVEYYHKDGSTVWMENTIKAMLDPSGQWIGIYGVSRDITERRRADKTLQAERERFRSLSESAPFGMVMIDNNGTFKYINLKFKELFGYDLNDVPNGRIWFRMAYPDSDYRHQVISTWLNDLDSSRSGETRPRVFTAKCKDGAEKIVNFISVKLDSGENLLACEDITDLKRAEEALKRSEEEAKQLAQENAVMAEIGQTLSSTLNIEEVYERFVGQVRKLIPLDRIAVNLIDHEEKMVFIAYTFGVEVTDSRFGGKFPLSGSFTEEVMQARHGLLIQAQDAGEIKHRHPALLTTFQAGLQSILSVPLLSKDEVIGVLHLRSSKQNAYTDKDLMLAERVANQIAGAIANSQLFKELLHSEEEKMAIQEQLRQSQKMEAIGRLAGGIAHDFNNLLTVIKGYSELSLFGLQDEDPIKENINEICKASERAANLTRQLLAFSRKQILDFKVLNLNSLILDLDKMLHRILGEDIQLIYKLDENIARVKTDPGQIGQVILNLVVNARDAMPSGGKLVIQTDQADEMDTPTLLSTIPGGYVRLSITDTGVGMTREVKEHLFEPFFTTKGKGKGTGLGLSTVYGIVKQSDGNINVSSEHGQGTTFHIYLPRIEEEEDISESKQDGIPLLTGNETILLVEDEQAVRELATRVLSNRGYQLCPAPDGQEALKFIQDHPNQIIHLLLTDVVMPGMSGKELADHLKLSTPHTKVLFISGYTDDAIVHHGILDKGVNFVHKPFTPEALARKVREVLDH